MFSIFDNDQELKALTVFDSASNISLNELLVINRYAEYKFEDEMSLHHNQLRDINNFYQKCNEAKNPPVNKEFELFFDSDLSSLTEHQLNVSIW